MVLLPVSPDLLTRDRRDPTSWDLPPWGSATPTSQPIPTFSAASSPHPSSAQLPLCGQKRSDFPGMCRKSPLRPITHAPREGVHWHWVVHSLAGTHTRVGLWLLTLSSDWGSGEWRTLFPPQAKGFLTGQALHGHHQTGSSQRTEWWRDKAGLCLHLGAQSLAAVSASTFA